MSFGADSPDYRGAAEAQGQSSVNAINAQTQANRPNIYTPWGSMEWSNNGGNWTGRVNLSPDQQAALDDQQKIQRERSGIAQGLEGQVAKDFSTPMDWGALPGMPNAEQTRGEAYNAIYGRETSRLDPQWSQREDQMRTSLMNQGLDPNSEAFTRQMDQFNRGRNDAYSTARQDAETGSGAAAQQMYGMGMGTRQQAISEALTKRMQPFNEMQAMLGGAQVGMPSFPGFSQAGAAQPTQYLGAAQAQGQFNLQNQSMINSGWGDVFQGAGQMGAAAIPFMF